MHKRCGVCSTCWSGDDPGPERRQGLDREWPHGHAPWHASLALMVQESLKRQPHAGDLYIFRGRSGSLVKILWHDGVGMSLYAKRLDRGKFIWPSASAGAVSISAAQMACMLEGIDWRNPQLTWRPQSAG
jgi:transposase